MQFTADDLNNIIPVLLASGLAVIGYWGRNLRIAQRIAINELRSDLKDIVEAQTASNKALAILSSDAPDVARAILSQGEALAELRTSTAVLDSKLATHLEWHDKLITRQSAD